MIALSPVRAVLLSKGSHYSQSLRLQHIYYGDDNTLSVYILSAYVTRATSQLHKTQEV